MCAINSKVKLYFSDREPRVIGQPDYSRRAMEIPSPHPSTSPLFAGLKELVQSARSPQHSPTGPSAGQTTRFSNGNNNEETEIRQNYIPIAQRLFQSQKTFPHVRRSLSSVVSAKSFVYGSTFFGQKH